MFSVLDLSKICLKNQTQVKFSEKPENQVRIIRNFYPATEMLSKICSDSMNSVTMLPRMLPKQKNSKRMPQIAHKLPSEAKSMIFLDSGHESKIFWPLRSQANRDFSPLPQKNCILPLAIKKECPRSQFTPRPRLKR